MSDQLYGPARRPRRPVPGELRHRAGQVMKSPRPPTVAISRPGDVDGPADAQARAVIDLVLRIGEGLLGTGSSASDTTATLLRLAHAYGLRSLHVDVIYSSITISYHRGPQRDPMTVMRIVPTMAADYSRLESLHTLVRELVDQPGDVGWARERLDRIMERHHPYRRGIVTMGQAALGGSLAAFFGGGPVLVVLAAVLAAVVDRAQRGMSRLGVATFFSQAVGGAIPTLTALALWAWVDITGRQLPIGIYPSVVVATGVVVLLAGLSVVSAAQDTLDGYYVTSTARAAEVLLLSGGVVAGVLAGLALGQRLGVTLAVDPRVGLSGHLPVEILAAICMSAAVALSSYSRPRVVALSAAIGGLTWCFYRLSDLLDLGAVSATFIAALVGAGVGQLVAYRKRVPALALTTAAIVPLLPGLKVFRGLYHVVHDPNGLGQGMASLLEAGITGLAIAAGVSLGALPVRWAHGDRLQRRLLRLSGTGTRRVT